MRHQGAQSQMRVTTGLPHSSPHRKSQSCTAALHGQRTQTPRRPSRHLLAYKGVAFKVSGFWGCPSQAAHPDAVKHDVG